LVLPGEREIILSGSVSGWTIWSSRSVISTGDEVVSSADGAQAIPGNSNMTETKQMAASQRSYFHQYLRE